MPRVKGLLLWSSSVLLALTISCAAPSQTVKPKPNVPAPETVEPTPVPPEVTPTPEPAPTPVPLVKPKHPPADSGPRYETKRTAPVEPQEQPASSLWTKAEEPAEQPEPAAAEPEPTPESASETGLTGVQPAAPLSEEPAPRSGKSGGLWLVLLGVAIVAFAVVIWMAGRRQVVERPAKTEEKPRPPVEARPVERPHTVHESKPAPVFHAKEETNKQLVLPAMPETAPRPVVRVAASAKKTASRRKTVARKTTRSRKEGTRRAAAARRRSAASGRRKVVSLAKRPARRRKA